jgi:hypothetical protein
MNGMHGRRDVYWLYMCDAKRLRVHAVPVTLITVHRVMQPDLPPAFAPRCKHPEMPSTQQKNSRLVQSRGEMSGRRVGSQDEA